MLSLPLKKTWMHTLDGEVSGSDLISRILVVRFWFGAHVGAHVHGSLLSAYSVYSGNRLDNLSTR